MKTDPKEKEEKYYMSIKKKIHKGELRLD